MSATLSQRATDLADYMSTISEDRFSAGWIHGLEWMLWHELSAWRRWTVPVHNLGIDDRLPHLDELQQAAGGWVWWLDGRRFVSDARWRALCVARASFGLTAVVTNAAVLARADHLDHPPPPKEQ